MGIGAGLVAALAMAVIFGPARIAIAHVELVPLLTALIGGFGTWLLLSWRPLRIVNGVLVGIVTALLTYPIVGCLIVRLMDRAQSEASSLQAWGLVYAFAGLLTTGWLILPAAGVAGGLLVRFYGRQLGQQGGRP